MDELTVNLLKLSGCLIAMIALQGVVGTASERRAKRRGQEHTDGESKKEDMQ